MLMGGQKLKLASVEYTNVRICDELGNCEDLDDQEFEDPIRTDLELTKQGRRSLPSIPFFWVIFSSLFYYMLFFNVAGI